MLVLSGASHAASSRSDSTHTPRVGHRAPGDSVYVVAPIIVDAARIDPRHTRFDHPGFVAAVNVSARRARVGGLADLLSPLVGVHVREYGGLDDFATVSIRGSSMSQVALYLDGVPVVDPYSGINNLSDLPLGGIERIEVFRGYSPTSFGASSIGGAINLVSQPEESGARTSPAGGEFDASYGSFTTSRQRITARARHSFLSAKLHTSHTLSRGNFDFFDDNGTPENPADDHNSIRANNDRESWNTLLRVNAHTRTGRITLGTDWFAREHGVPGIGVNQSKTARSERTRALYQASFAGGPWHGLLLADASAWRSRSSDRFHDPGADIALTGTDTDNRFDGGGARVHVRAYPPRTPVVIDAVVDTRNDRFRPKDNTLSQPAGEPQWRHVRTTSLTGEVHLLGGALLATATARHEHTEAEYQEAPRFPWLPETPTGRIESDARTPSAGFRWRVANWAVLKGSVGRYQRLPGFLELFGNAGSVSGNPELAAETGTNRDLGVVFTANRVAWFRNAFAEIAWVSSTAENLILFFPNSQFTSRPVNIGASRIRGIETSASAVIGERVRTSLSWTRLKTRDTSAIPFYSGNELPSRPRDELSATIHVPANRWNITYEFHFTAANWLDRANLQRTRARPLHNTSVSVTLPAGLELTFEARNVTNQRVSDVSGFPLPGRSFFTSVRYATR